MLAEGASLTHGDYASGVTELRFVTMWTYTLKERRMHRVHFNDFLAFWLTHELGLLLLLEGQLERRIFIGDIRENKTVKHNEMHKLLFVCFIKKLFKSLKMYFFTYL